MKLRDKSLTELLKLEKDNMREVGEAQDRLLASVSVEEIHNLKSMIRRLEKESDKLADAITLTKRADRRHGKSR